MRIVEQYSHLNGEEYLLAHHKQLWREDKETIANVDAKTCKTKVSKEKTMLGQMLFSPVDLNKLFEVRFRARGWKETSKLSWHRRCGATGSARADFFRVRDRYRQTPEPNHPSN